MRLGTDTASLVNHVTAGYADAIAEVGMGATGLGWTDRHAWTIVAVGKADQFGRPRWVEATRDTATRTDSNGMSDAQSYSYTSNPDGARTRFTLRRNGRYVQVGDSLSGYVLKLGARNAYHDYSF